MPTKRKRTSTVLEVMPIKPVWAEPGMEYRILKGKSGKVRYELYKDDKKVPLKVKGAIPDKTNPYYRPGRLARNNPVVRKGKWNATKFLGYIGRAKERAESYREK